MCAMHIMHGLVAMAYDKGYGIQKINEYTLHTSKILKKYWRISEWKKYHTYFGMHDTRNKTWSARQ